MGSLREGREARRCLGGRPTWMPARAHLGPVPGLPEVLGLGAVRFPIKTPEMLNPRRKRFHAELNF